MPLPKTKPLGRDARVLLLFDYGVDVETIALALAYHPQTIRKILRLHRGGLGKGVYYRLPPSKEPDRQSVA